jgi:hypothetical protein
MGENANPPASTFLVISSGKVYLATDNAADAASSGNGLRTVDYSRWRGMTFVQIGDHAHSTDVCGFSCQSGLSQSPVINSRMTWTFTGTNLESTRGMNNILVYNE